VGGDKLRVPVIDHWWQTETGWAIAGNPVGLGKLPIKLGSPTVAMPGYDVQVWTMRPSGARRHARQHRGQAAAAAGCLPTLWNNDERFKASYLEEFPGYYKTADAGMIDEDGYLFIMARTDDIINVAGHRLSTGGMEEVLAGHPAVAEAAVIGVADAAQGPAASRLRRVQGRGRHARSSSKKSWSRWCARRSARSRPSRR
jgi:propionyl-CoA synthetase